jgi:hypothetical protein
MRYNTLFNTTIAQTSGFKRLAENAVQYLGMNSTGCLVDDYTNSMIMKLACNNLKTPIGVLFEHIYDHYKATKFPMVHIYVKTGSVPEIMAADQIVIDCREVLKNYNSVFDNCIVNYTNIMTIQGPDKIKLQDLTSVQNQYLRAALCSSYNMSGDSLWLSSQMAVFVMNAYANIMVTLLRTTFNITDPAILANLRMVLTAFYSQKLEADTGSLDRPQLPYRAARGRGVEVDEFYGKMADAGYNYKQAYTLYDLLNQLKAISGDRLESLDLERMIKIFTAGSTDAVSAIISLEYPPYWVYLMLHIASGGKHAVYNNIFRNMGMKQEIAAFANDLNRYPAFITSIASTAK